MRVSGLPPAGRLANNQLRLDGDLGRIVLSALNAFQQGLRSNGSHARQWLPYRRQAGRVEGGSLDVVETDYRDVVWHANASFLESANCAQCRDVVEGKECGERNFALEQLLREGIANLWSWVVHVDLHRQLRPDLNVQSACHLADRVPADLGIRAEGLTLHKCYVLVSKIQQVL